MELAPGAVVAQRYTIERKIGGGGMGVVHRARDAKFGVVALKLAAASGAALEEFRRRFEREARLGHELGRLPGVVRALDWGELPERGSLYLVMDLVSDAGPLDLATGSLRARLERLRTAAEIVARVHAAGVIHRDLKPANFLETKDGKIWLTDFGLAKTRADLPDAASHELSLSGVGFGTPAFMPPEQFDSAKHADERADVYALGVMLFAILANGRLPFEGTPATIIRTQDRALGGREAMPTARSHDPTVPASLDGLCSSAIALDRDRRLPTVAAFVAGLTAFLEPPAPTIREAPPEPDSIGAKPTLVPPPEGHESLELVDPEPESQTVVPEPESPDPVSPEPVSLPATTPAPRGSALPVALVLGVLLLVVGAAAFLAWRDDAASHALPLEPSPPASASPPAPAVSPSGVASAPALTFLELKPSSGPLEETSVAISGKLSDPRRGPVVFRDAASVFSASVTVGADGAFGLRLDLAAGEREILLSAADGEVHAKLVFTVDVSKKLAALETAASTALPQLSEPVAAHRSGVFEAKWWRLASHRGLAALLERDAWPRRELDAYLVERLRDEGFVRAFATKLTPPAGGDGHFLDAVLAAAASQEAPGRRASLVAAVEPCLDALDDDDPRRATILELVKEDLARKIAAESADDEHDAAVSRELRQAYWGGAVHSAAVTRGFESAAAAADEVRALTIPALEATFTSRLGIEAAVSDDAVAKLTQATERLDAAVVAAVAPSGGPDENVARVFDGLFSVRDAFARRRLAIQGDHRGLTLHTLVDLVEIVASAERKLLADDNAFDAEQAAANARVDSLAAYLRHLAAQGTSEITLMSATPLDAGGFEWPQGGWVRFTLVSPDALAEARSEGRVVLFDERTFLLPVTPAVPPKTEEELVLAHALEVWGELTLPPTTIRVP